VNLLIVDDHAPFRRLARMLLSRHGFDVVGEADDAATALAAADALTPDVVLLDVQLPDRDGISVAEELANGAHPPRVVLTSSRPARDYGQRLREAPIAGFIRKDEVSADTLGSILSE
jgi:DNA-binding NarL/FixJ family response regulator